MRPNIGPAAAGPTGPVATALKYMGLHALRWDPHWTACGHHIGLLQWCSDCIAVLCRRSHRGRYMMTTITTVWRDSFLQATIEAL